MLVTCCIKKRSVQNIIELFLYSPVINYGHISAILSPPHTNSRLASLADFFSPTPMFYSFFRQCGAWSQARLYIYIYGALLANF